MLQNNFQINLLFEEGSTQQYCITDKYSGEIIATFDPDEISHNVSGKEILETFKNIFHAPFSDDQGVFISYHTARNRTVDALASR